MGTIGSRNEMWGDGEENEYMEMYKERERVNRKKVGYMDKLIDRLIEKII